MLEPSLDPLYAELITNYPFLDPLHGSTTLTMLAKKFLQPVFEAVKAKYGKGDKFMIPRTAHKSVYSRSGIACGTGLTNLPAVPRPEGLLTADAYDTQFLIILVSLGA